jgi:predicted Zn-dependent protease
MTPRWLSALMSGCVALSCVAPGVAFAQPAPSSTEASLRYQFDDMERRILRSGRRNTDAALNEYIHTLGCRVAAGRCAELRFYVIETSEFNASMAPNGMMLINSGLLLRAESEAEVAFVMAHEFAHYSENHMLERIDAVRGAVAGGSALTLALAFTGIGALATLGYTATLVGTMAFTRDQERESDMFASRFANENGYDSAGGVRAWENLRAEISTSSNETTRRRLTRGSMFASHPLTDERIAYLSEAPRNHPDAGVDRAAYRAIIRPHLQHWLAAEISDRDAGATLTLLERLATQGADMGIIEYTRGEAYRARNAEGDQALALASYNNATTHVDAPAETWRQIGIMQRRANDNTAAAAAFTRYLELAPEAADRPFIESMLTTLGGTAQ